MRLRRFLVVCVLNRLGILDDGRLLCSQDNVAAGTLDFGQCP